MDEFADDPKITRLPMRTPPPDDIRTEVARLLAEAETEGVDGHDTRADTPDATPAPTTAAPAADSKAPPPHHRNTVECPQCDRWTWRGNWRCFHCAYDLAGHFQRAAQGREDQRLAAQRSRIIRWTLATGIGGAATLLGSTLLPTALGFPIGTVGLLAALAACFVGWQID